MADVTLEDQDLVLSTVHEFAKKHMAPAVEIYEKTVADPTIKSILQKACDLGILPHGHEEGLGLWENLDTSSGLVLSLRVLIALGEVNAGIAFHMHQLALGHALSTRLPGAKSFPTVPLLQGLHGTARGALFRFLANDSFSSEESRLIHEHFSTGTIAPLHLQASTLWDYLLLPELHDEKLTWRCYHENTLIIQEIPHPHGLDETKLWEIQIPEDAPSSLHSSLDETSAKQLLIEALGINSLGILALSLGSVKKAFQKAKIYANERVQGGQLIAQHPAIQLLLGNMNSILGSLEPLLLQFAGIPQTMQDLSAILKVRAVAHPLLCQGATDALQVFGGYGYMRDYGMEKILRDNQHLKLLFGTPNDLKLSLGQGGL